MMKLTIKIMIITVAVALIVSGVYFLLREREPVLSENAVAAVNGVEITREQVDNRILINQIRNKAYADTLWENMQEDDASAAYAKVQGAIDQTGALEELILGEVVRQYLKEDQLSFEETKIQLEREWNLLQTDDSQKAFYKHFQGAMSEYQQTADETLTLSEQFSYDLYNITKLKIVFAKSDDYNSDSKITLDEQFDAYCQELIAQAKVVYP